MAKIEKDIQNRFFDILLQQQKGFENSTINVYQKLVYTRYEEVIKNSLPLFLDFISENELKDSILKFMKDTPYTPFVWKIPNDYRKYAKKNKIFDNKKYIYELMYFDWVEIEIYMKEYKLEELDNFAYENTYRLSKSARIKKSKFDIIGKDYESKRENYSIIYYDFEKDDVIYREINPLIYFLIKNTNKKESLYITLEKICIENEIDINEALIILKEPLEDLYRQRVFV
ncbi:MAG: hypothetical protein GY932_01650 [Arcobacter sp.]|nr:hypothetical protein [Arcobacter sp.]